MSFAERYLDQTLLRMLTPNENEALEAARPLLEKAIPGLQPDPEDEEETDEHELFPGEAV